jgi:hypothetical protein
VIRPVRAAGETDRRGQGRLVPPPNPRGTGSLRGWCHPSVRLRQEARNSATRQSGAPPSWCHPSVRRGQLVPPVIPRTNWCHPSVRLRQGQSASPKQCHPSVRRAAYPVPPAAKLVPPVRLPKANWKPTGATRRFVSSRVREEARNSATPQFVSGEMQAWCHPPIWGAEVASLLLASPPRIAPVRPL